MKLRLSKETLVELTADDLSAVVGGAAESGSCTIASCVTNDYTSGTTRAVTALVAVDCG
jgi:hypothetical protein